MRLKLPELIVYRQIKLYLVCLFLLTFDSSSGQTADEIIKRYFEVSSQGDLAQWSKIKTLYATCIGYYSEASFETQKDTFDSANLSYIKVYKRWPNEQKEELFSDSLFRKRTSSFYYLKNRRVIRFEYMDPIEVDPDEKTTFDFYPTRINNYLLRSKSINYNGIKTIPGKPTSYYEIEIKTPDFDHVFLFNIESYLLEAIYFPEPNIYWLISDYKLFDGYLLPTYIASMRNGVIFDWRRYKTFVFNPKFREDLFNPDH